MTPIVIATHLHPDRARMTVPGHFETLSREARHAGMREITLPYRQPHLWAAALERLPSSSVVYFNGGVPGDQLMRAFAHAAAETGLTPLNTPEQNAQIMRFEQFYPHISDLTAPSVIVTAPDQALAALDTLTLPVFVKGSIISRKHHGWDACVARDRDELVTLCQMHGTAVVRQLLDLRRCGATHGDFPAAREYRYFIHGQRVLGAGYFWPGADPFGVLTDDDDRAARELAVRAADRVDAPLVCVDVAQLNDSSWTVIELGDPQHTGVAHMPRLVFWQELTSALTTT